MTNFQDLDLFTIDSDQGMKVCNPSSIINEYFGTSVSNVEDLNVDLIDKVTVGSWDENESYCLCYFWKS